MGEAGDFSGAGVASAVRSAVDEAGPLLPLRDGDQLALISDETGGYPTPAAIGAAVRGRGRPKGATNKRGEAVRSYLLSRYAHPLEVLAQTYSRPVDVLSRELGCTKAEAMALQLKAAVELAPYVEGKMPVTVDLRAKGDVVLVMPGFNAPAGSVQDAGDLVAAGGIEALGWADAQEADFTPVSDETGAPLE